MVDRNRVLAIDPLSQKGSAFVVMPLQVKIDFS